MNFIKVSFLLLPTIYSTNSQALECKISDPTEFAWFSSLNIDEKSGKITLVETEDQGKNTYTTKLIDLTDNRYTFNLMPLEGSDIAHMFLLLKSFDEWRLLSVGTEQKNGQTVLRATDKSTRYDCVNGQDDETQ